MTRSASFRTVLVLATAAQLALAPAPGSADSFTAINSAPPNWK